MAMESTKAQAMTTAMKGSLWMSSACAIAAQNGDGELKIPRCVGWLVLQLLQDFREIKLGQAHERRRHVRNV